MKLRRVFIIFLAVALIGLAASTYYYFSDRYYYFSDQKTVLPFMGSSAKDGRIANALNANLRTDPAGSVVATLPEGSRVRVVEERGGWVRIRVLEWTGTAPENAPDSGWVDARFVKLD